MYLLIISAFLLSGCVDFLGQSGFRASNTAGGTTPEGTTTPGGITTPVGGTEVSNVPELCTDLIISPKVIHRLNRDEYINSARIITESSFYPAVIDSMTESSFGFINYASNITTNDIHGSIFFAAAEQMASHMVQNKNFAASCFNGQSVQDVACIKQNLSDLISTTFRLLSVPSSVLNEFYNFFTSLTDVNKKNSLESTLVAVFSDPRFLYRAETAQTNAASGVRSLSSQEILSRLSYYLWGSGPSKELIARAASLNFSSESTLRSFVVEMLNDPKSDYLVETLMTRWLNIARVDTAASAEAQRLRSLFFNESKYYFKNLIANNRPVSEMVDSKYSFLNKELAEHYGVNSAGLSSEFSRYDFDGSQKRGALLAQGSFLAALGTTDMEPHMSHIVVRGVSVLRDITCTPIGDPPDGATDTEIEIDESKSKREKIEAVTSPAACISCHSLINPIGFALDNFDLSAKYRENYEGKTIDVSGSFVKTAFSDLGELKTILGKSPSIPKCAVDKVLSFAMGRQVDANDRCAVDNILNRLGEEPKFRDLIVEIALSNAMLTKKED